MGFIEGQRAKQDERVRAALSDKLRTGETVTVHLHAMSHVSWFKFFFAAFPGLFLLEYTGRGSYSPWMLGLAMGIWYAVVVRQYMLVMTDRRFLAMRLKPLSSKKVDEVNECRLEELRVEYDRAFVNGKMTVGCGETEKKFTIARAFEDRAKQFPTYAKATAQPTSD